eukprot:10905865-Alexandrium_andersonii.AAC.1
MSASLVGSEMCIRDSTRTTQKSAFGALRQRRFSGHPGGAQTAAYSVLRAVSYTHLTLPTICSV